MLLSVLDGEVHSALLVKAHILYVYNVAELEHVLDLLDSVRSDLGDVYHSLLAGCVFNKAAELLDTCYGTGVYTADLGLEYDSSDASTRRLCLIVVDSGDTNDTYRLSVTAERGSRFCLFYFALRLR